MSVIGFILNCVCLNAMIARQNYKLRTLRRYDVLISSTKYIATRLRNFLFIIRLIFHNITYLDLE